MLHESPLPTANAVPDDLDAAPAWHVTPAAYLATRPATSQTVRAVSRYVAMPDGCRLAVDVYLPATGHAQAARHATIVVFTPYYRRFQVADGASSEASPNTALYRDFFVPRGYALCVVDVRGTGASFGARDSFRSPREREDSYHVADWIVRQPWSNGVIGSTGISYLGAAADFLASTAHPAVKAIAPLFAVWDTYADNYFPGGIALTALTRHYEVFTRGLDQNEPDLLRGYAQWADPGLRGPAPVDDDQDGTLLRAAVAEHRANFRQSEFMASIRVREDGLLHAPEISSASISPYGYAQHIREDVAILSVSGWADGAGYANGAISRYLSLPRNPRHLLLGPWDHGGRIDMSPWRTQETPDKLFMAETLRFFDTYLLGRDCGLSREQPVHYYAVHEEAWHAADHWPPGRSTERWHLGRQDLQRQAAPDVHEVRYQADFSLGTGAHTRYERIASLDPRAYYGDWDGRSDGSRMMAFESAPLTEELDIVGHVVASLQFASSERDAALHVYLTEVEADGRERHVTEGLLRAVHRQEAQAPTTYATSWPFRTFNRADAAPLQPGRHERVRIPLLPTAWRVARGSRLRLSIAGADADHCERIPAGRPPVFSVRIGGQDGSFIDIPTHNGAAATAPRHPEP